jgi:hypothetical protein
MPPVKTGIKFCVSHKYRVYLEKKSHIHFTSLNLINSYMPSHKIKKILKSRYLLISLWY